MILAQALSVPAKPQRPVSNSALSQQPASHSSQNTVDTLEAPSTGQGLAKKLAIVAAATVGTQALCSLAGLGNSAWSVAAGVAAGCFSGATLFCAAGTAAETLLLPTSPNWPANSTVAGGVLGAVAGAYLSGSAAGASTLAVAGGLAAAGLAVIHTGLLDQ